MTTNMPTQRKSRGDEAVHEARRSLRKAPRSRAIHHSIPTSTALPVFPTTRAFPFESSSQPCGVAVSWWWTSPLYPTSFNRPTISPTVKKPSTSATRTLPETSCARSTLRIRESMASGVIALEEGVPDMSDEGLRRAWRTGERYDWKAATSLENKCVSFVSRRRDRRS